MRIAKKLIPRQINKVSENGKRFLPTDECTVTARYYKGVLSNNSNIVIEESRMEKVLGSVYTDVSDRFQRGLYPIARTVKAEHHDLAVVVEVMEEKEVKQLGNIAEFNGSWDNPQIGRVYSTDGIAPTISTCQGGGTGSQ